jgi:site-specific DNA recombinase
MKRQVVTYIRVSTEEQAKHGYSIEAQRQILQDYAKGHELEIVHEFQESKSAFKPGRPEFKKMLALLKRRRSITAVLCYKIDRIARNLQDYSALDEMAGVSIISATEALPENSTGKLIGTVQAAFSRFYSEQLGERVSLGMQTKVQKGFWPTRAPIGYVNDRDTKTIVRDPERAHLIREIFEIYARGDLPLSELVQWTRTRGFSTRAGKPLSKSELHKLLTNPAYCGRIPWKGVLYEGVHEPIVSKALFNRVQERLRGRSHPRTARLFPYRGLLQCGYCGCKITASLEKKKYIYYHCTHGRGKCRQPYIGQESLGQKLQEVVDDIHIPKAQVSTLLEKLREDSSQHELEKARSVRRVTREIERVSGHRDASYIDKLDGSISGERWLQLERKWSRSVDALEAELEILDSAPAPLLDDVEVAFELLERAPSLYMRQTHAERARLLRALLSNCILRGEKIDPIYRIPFDAVAVGVKTGKWWTCLDSNQGPPAYQASALNQLSYRS